MIGCIILISVAVLFLGLFIASAVSGKSMKHVLVEIRYEIIYNLIGSKALLEDIAMRERNDNVDIPMATGKVVVITGGARGIAVEVVKKLVKCDAHVIIGCRNVTAGENLLKTIRAEGIDSGDIRVFELDLNSCESVKSFAQDVKQQCSKIHVLINNAGKMFGPFIESVDGFESQFATNYLGHFLLTHLLLPEIKAAGEENKNARIVNVSSCAHLVGDINFADINFRNEYISSAAYAQSKLAQVLFSNCLNATLKDEGVPVAVYSVHPGIVDTELFNGTYLKTFTPAWVLKKLFKTPKQGAASILYASLSRKLEGKGGTYISNCHIMQASESTYSTDLQEKMFQFSKSLLNIKVFGKELN